jgi:ERCC4-type nuclease
MFTILRDNREQTGWDFADYDASVSDETVKTGDYTVAEFCDHDPELDTYYPNFAVERKNGNDFIDSISSSRTRFKSEIARASDWPSPLHVVVEAPRQTFKRGTGFMQYREMQWSQISGTVEKWSEYMNVKFHFAPNAEMAEQRAYSILSSELASRLVR